ncbi:MAG TPA: hypothetical protein VGF25_16590 [Thermoleophilaceae bacterium]|jgi:hypothetical protein
MDEASVSAEGLTAEEEALIRRAAETTMRLRLAVVDVAGVYVRLGPDARGLDVAARGRAAAEVERVAELWRDGEMAGSWEVEREVGWAAPGHLLGALQDSLILALSSRPGRRAQLLPVDEAVRRVEALEAEGAFEGLDRVGEGSAGGDAPPRPGEQTDALADSLIVACARTFAFYLDLAPDGRPLEARSVEALECLEAAASCNRALDRERDLLEQPGAGPRLDPARAILRAMQNGLVLALSGDPARRAKAMPAGELRRRMRPLEEALDLPTGSRRG